ncbi:conserved hypothetical protein [Methanococcus vannielii SB]|jgi:hypothetical protein|uniref:Uncharacterized protein n=1 Tax=Methanococcus vannielii (strain ATCC 35089 / DSM 1224 / JCM 13029 / OCM 148 / SB) TaxID=406327 RepID=A6USU2_METVS|nr:DUF4013 domain-containing protein [Methanococcus vannielii]ABR55564.1 conserved hypothetical protein [Methanococcus vannielii SB]
MFFKNYVTEPLKYGLTDSSKIVKGGLLYGIGMVLMYSSIFAIFYPLIGQLVPLNFPYNSGIIMTIGFLIGLISLILMIVVSGYFLNIIKKSINKSENLPDWNNYYGLFKTGFVFFIGVMFISIAFTIIQQLINYLIGYTGTNEGILIAISIFISIFQSLYIPIASISYAHKGDFYAFFDMPYILKKMSLEYLAVFIVVMIVTTIITLVPTAIVILIAVFAIIFIYGSIAYSTELVLASGFIGGPLMIILSILYFYSGVYSYRAFTNYFISKID